MLFFCDFAGFLVEYSFCIAFTLEVSAFTLPANSYQCVHAFPQIFRAIPLKLHAFHSTFADMANEGRHVSLLSHENSC